MDEQQITQITQDLSQYEHLLFREVSPVSNRTFSKFYGHAVQLLEEVRSLTGQLASLRKETSLEALDMRLRKLERYVLSPDTYDAEVRDTLQAADNAQRVLSGQFVQTGRPKDVSAYPDSATAWSLLKRLLDLDARYEKITASYDASRPVFGWQFVGRSAVTELFDIMSDIRKAFGRRLRV